MVFVSENDVIVELQKKKILNSKQFLEINHTLSDKGCKFKKPHLVPVFLPFLALPDIRILYSGIVDIKKREFVPTIIS